MNPQQRLQAACRAGEEEEVQDLLDTERSLDVNQKGEDGSTPLIIACKMRRYDVVKVLLDHEKLKVKQADSDGCRAIHYAAKRGFHKITGLLLAHSANVNAQDRHGATPLFLALECLRALPSGGPLRLSEDFTECLKLLLASRADVNLPNTEGLTPLMLACETGVLPAVEMLLKHGAKVDAKSESGVSAAHVATEAGHVPCLQALISGGAALNVQTDEGATPLYLASDGGHHDCLKSLVDAGADCQVALLKKKETPLYAASLRGHVSCVEALLPRSDLDARTSGGFTAVCAASEEGNPRCLFSLLRAGADHGIKDNVGRTPVLKATAKGHLECVELLLRYKVEIDWADPRAPLQVAKTLKRREVVALLEDYIQAPEKYHAKAEMADEDLLGPEQSPYKVSISVKKKKPPRKCDYMDRTRRFLHSLKLTGTYLDSQHDVCFCEVCHKSRGDKFYYTRGSPPKTYGMPIGWCKFGLKLPPKAEGLDVFTKWHVAFHGTRVDCLQEILDTGDLLMPGDITPAGAELRPPGNHYDDKGDKARLRPPPGHDVMKIYVSPSIKYAGHEVYAPAIKHSDPKDSGSYHARVAFQVRVQPGSYTVGGKTISSTGIDPKFSDDELEWCTNRRGVTILVGLLVRLESKALRVNPDVTTQVAMPVSQTGRAGATSQAQYTRKAPPKSQPQQSQKQSKMCLIM